MPTIQVSPGSRIIRVGPDGASAAIYPSTGTIEVLNAPPAQVKVTTLAPQNVAVRSVTEEVNIYAPGGPPGPPGPQGQGIVIKGTVATHASLPTTGNTVGDMWITADTGHGWVWQANSTWLDAGPIQGPPGPPGASAASKTICGETPVGAINGTNLNYASANPYSPGLLSVYLNGLRLRRAGDYTETGSQSFQFLSAPLPGDSLSIDYIQP
jgi:hypothetical protein